MSLGVSFSAVVSWHLLSLDDTRRIGAGSDRAGTTVLRVAVGVRSAAKAVALDDALEAAAFGRSGDLDLLARRKNLHRDFVTKIVGRNRFLVLLELRVVEAEA